MEKFIKEFCDLMDKLSLLQQMINADESAVEELVDNLLMKYLGNERLMAAKFMCKFGDENFRGTASEILPHLMKSRQIRLDPTLEIGHYLYTTTSDYEMVMKIFETGMNDSLIKLSKFIEGYLLCSNQIGKRRTAEEIFSLLENFQGELKALGLDTRDFEDQIGKSIPIFAATLDRA